MSEPSMSALRSAVARRQIGAIRALLPVLTSRVELLMVAGTAGIHATPDGAQCIASMASDCPWEKPSVADSRALVEAGRLLHMADRFGFWWRVADLFRPAPGRVQ